MPKLRQDFISRWNVIRLQYVIKMKHSATFVTGRRIHIGVKMSISLRIWGVSRKSKVFHYLSTIRLKQNDCIICLISGKPDICIHLICEFNQFWNPIFHSAHINFDMQEIILYKRYVCLPCLPLSIQNKDLGTVLILFCPVLE